MIESGKGTEQVYFFDKNKSQLPFKKRLHFCPSVGSVITSPHSSRLGKIVDIVWRFDLQETYIYCWVEYDYSGDLECLIR